MKLNTILGLFLSSIVCYQQIFSYTYHVNNKTQDTIKIALTVGGKGTSTTYKRDAQPGQNKKIGVGGIRRGQCAHKIRITTIASPARLDNGKMKTALGEKDLGLVCGNHSWTVTRSERSLPEDEYNID